MFAAPLGRTRRATLVGLALVVSWSALPAKADTPHITDPAEDAYRYPDSPAGQPETKPTMPMLSDPPADVLAVVFAGSPEESRATAYSVSVSVSGEPHPAYNYMVWASFGDGCWLFHYLSPGSARPAMASCGEGRDWRLEGSIPGSAATVTASQVSATFDYGGVGPPGSLGSDPEIGPMYVMTCPVEQRSWSCDADNFLDYGASDATFRL